MRSIRFLPLLLLLPGLVLPAPAPAANEPEDADDLLIVDCLLPQKVRRLGRNNTYLQPRRPIRTTAADCRIRGGEYTEPDQANYATSLKVWLPRAKGGDAEAQYFVGQIFERGLGGESDPKSAADWYLKAAEQGHGPSQISLGSLYEEGRGVAADPVAAMNWYRKAAGLEQDLVVLEQGDYQQLLDAKSELEGLRNEAENLQGEIEEMRRQVEAAAAAGEAESSRRATLESVVARLEKDLAERRQQVLSGEKQIAELESRVAAAADAPAGSNAKTASLSEIPFGKYHALVIGNGDYRELPDLESSREDARQVADLLESKYGFEVDLLLDADRFQILSAFNDLRESLTKKDNLLVYYAGHGERDSAGQKAYWQPVDAAPANPSNWIPSALVAEHLDLIAANHVFLVANSIFTGLRTRSSVLRLPQGMTEEERYFHIKRLEERRSRLVLAAGRDPDPESAFASAFLDALESNDGVLEASSLFRTVNDRVSESASGGVEFASLKWARHDLADFFFVPTALLR